jgi:hypothetical protein
MKRKIKQNADSGVKTGTMTGLFRLVFCTGIVLITCSACEDWEKKTQEDGQLASKEFCDCYKKSSKDKCFEQLKSDYSNYESDTFIKAFNEANTCNFKLVKETVGSAPNAEPGIITIE